MNVISIVPNRMAADSPEGTRRVVVAMATDPYWGRY